ncbi:MAG: GntR family transcriptional regulator [Desulfovibrionales bacterium]
MPLYHQLAEAILAEIRSGVYAVGAKIPSENELAAVYSIGRPTVRQALDSLVRKGILVRRRGAGTFVAPQPETVDLFSLGGTMASFRSTGHTPRVELVAPPQLREVKGDPVNPFSRGMAIVLCRVSRVEDTPVLVEDIYLHPTLFAAVEAMDLRSVSLSRVVEERFHLQLSGGEQRFCIRYPDPRLSDLLDLSKTTPILAVNRFLHFPDVQNGIYSELFCRTDRFVFTQTIGGT